MVVVRKPKDLNRIANIAMPEKGVIVMVFNTTLNNTIGHIKTVDFL
jgi:hypothetical protein